METQEVETKEAEIDEELCCILLTEVIDGTAFHVGSARKERSRHQTITELKRWFSGSDAPQNTIDSMLD